MKMKKICRRFTLLFCISLFVISLACAFAACGGGGSADYYLSLASTGWQTYNSNDRVPDGVRFTSNGNDRYTLEITLEEGEQFTVNQVKSENKIGFDSVFSATNDLIGGENGSVKVAHSGTFALSYYPADNTLTYDYTAQAVSVKIATTVANLNVGDEYPYKATVVYSNGNEVEESAEWTSSNEEILSVDKDGVVSALAKGTATLTAMAHGFTSEPLSITVSMSSIPVTGIQLDKQTLAMEFGDEQQLTASVQPDDADDQRVIWQSDNESAVTVTQDGKVKAVGYGEAIITATTAQYGFHAECKVTVVKHVEAMRFVSEKLTVVVGGKTKELGLVFSPSDATNREVEIEVTSGNSYATVEETDGKFVLRGLAQGTATLTATLKENREITATCEVTVLAAGTELASMDQDIRVMIGGSIVLDATLENSTIQSVDWSIANETVATISGDGATATVTGVDFGSTVVTATVHAADGETYTATCNVLVADEWYFIYGYGLGKSDWDYADYVSDKNAAQLDELLFTEQSKGIYTLTRHLTSDNGFQIIFPQVASFTQHDDTTGEDVWSKNIPSHWVSASYYYQAQQSDSQYVKNAAEYFCVNAAGVYTVTLDLTGTSAKVYIKMVSLDVTDVQLELSNGNYVLSSGDEATVSFSVMPANAAYTENDVTYSLTSDYADYAKYLTVSLDFAQKTLTLSATAAPESFKAVLHLTVSGIEQTLEFNVLAASDEKVPATSISFEQEKYEFNVNNGAGNWTTVVKANVNADATNKQVRYYDVTDYDELLSHPTDERAIVDPVTGEVTARSLGTLKIKAVSLDNSSVYAIVDVLFYSDQIYLIGGSYGGWTALAQGVTTTNGTAREHYTFSPDESDHSRYTFTFTPDTTGDSGKFKIVFLGIDVNWTGEINYSNIVQELCNASFGWDSGNDVASGDSNNIVLATEAEFTLTVDLSLHKPVLLIDRTSRTEGADDYVLDFDGSTELKLGDTATARLLTVPFESFREDSVTVSFIGNEEGYLTKTYDAATNTLTFTVAKQAHKEDKTVTVSITVGDTTKELTFTILAEHHLELIWDEDNHWYRCTDEGCDYFEDSNGVANQKTAHDRQSSWASNAKGHYYACSGCEAEFGLAPHEYQLNNGVFDFSDGMKECSVCHFELFKIEGNTLVAYYGKAETVKVPDKVTILGDRVFEGHTELKTLTYSDQLTKIGQYAFAGCTNLTAVSIGNRVTSIGAYAFDGTAATVTFGKATELSEIGRCAFWGWLGTSITIPTSVKKLVEFCFAHSKLESIVVPDTVKYYNGGLFNECTSLKTAIIGSNAEICAEWFTGCTSLEYVLIKGDHFYQFNRESFTRCTSLKAVYVERPLEQILECNWLFMDTALRPLEKSLKGKVYIYSETNPGEDPFGEKYSNHFGYFRDWCAGTWHYDTDRTDRHNFNHIEIWDPGEATSLESMPVIVDDKRGYSQA